MTFNGCQQIQHIFKLSLLYDLLLLIYYENIGAEKHKMWVITYGWLFEDQFTITLNTANIHQQFLCGSCV